MIFGKMVKPIPATYYPPDGTGRDTYIIDDNGGTSIKFAPGGITFAHSDFLRLSGFPTPVMNKRQQDKIPSMKTYNNWPSIKEVERNRKLAVSQREHIRKLSESSRRVRDPIRDMVQNERKRSMDNMRLRQTNVTLEEKLE